MKMSFNIIGMFINAVDVTRNMIRVYDERLLELMVETLNQFGVANHTVIFHG